MTNSRKKRKENGIMEEEEIDVARLYIPDEYLIPGTAADSSADGTTLFELMLAKASG
jgi:hypothetical protein